ncbi:helix-turn-helix domain-containing protein [Desulfoscipio geothermicus]|uniref:HTH cro/C1-type domain-containing protein n=1 Tax=Desulfoscipio geothermicus DSM 3669 TaxID=1121426 RepID=A0A1I6ECQ1_9FIRM|nr:helix-turn-helix transcriptional regulator [Desulfoscipio geothermicus]SFR15417.1 hypothetical protein SAMN05660706_13549 [Desulfoscipio geothermicus DSM 3669]
MAHMGIGIKINVLEKLQSDKSLSDSQLASKIGVDYSLLWRIKTGRSKPGQKFIAKLLTVFPEIKFEDIFFLENMSHGFQEEIACNKNKPTGTEGR